MAFANSDIRGAGNGCVLWFRDLIDIRSPYETGGQDLYIRMSAAELGKEFSKHGHIISVKIKIAAAVAAISVILSLCIFVRVRRRITGKLLIFIIVNKVMTCTHIYSFQLKF